jgi:signal transduction histidine kinase
VGVLVELFVLNSALVYKIKKIQDDNNASQQKIIKELEENRKLTHRLNNIRDEISMDLHDELGGGLSSIRLLTELIKRKTINKENIKPLNKISESSNELVQKINEIVWALNISNDSLENLFAYIREYTMNFFDATNINCLFIQPEKIPDDLIEGHYRRAIFLAIKEALNNIVKHAEATEVEVKMTIDQNVEIEIRDNGKGIQFPLQNLSHNGLQNMNRRIKSIQGSVRFLNHHGTTVAISFPLKGLLHKSVI